MLLIFQSRVNNVKVLWAMYCLSPVEEMYNTFCLYFHKNAEHLLLPVDHMSQNVISSFADVEQRGKAV